MLLSEIQRQFGRTRNAAALFAAHDWSHLSYSTFMPTSSELPVEYQANNISYIWCSGCSRFSFTRKMSQRQRLQNVPRPTIRNRPEEKMANGYMYFKKNAKANKIPAAFSKAQPDKLFIRGKLLPEGRNLEIP